MIVVSVILVPTSFLFMYDVVFERKNHLCMMCLKENNLFWVLTFTHLQHISKLVAAANM